jgi:signal transduction histidine kinase
VTVGWITRPLAAVLLLAIVLVLVSGLLELTAAVRMAAGQASVEAAMVTGSVQREIGRMVTSARLDSLRSPVTDVGLQEALMDGLARAPSVLHVAVLSPDGRVLAHTESSMVGRLLPAYPTLPVVRSFRQSLRLLWSLRGNRATYQLETPLRLQGRPFARIRVDIAGAFVWSAVRQAASRGIVAAVIVVSLAVAAGILLTRLAAGRVRVLAAGVAAIREGRFERRLSETGVDEFGHLARELNLLGATIGRAQASEPIPGADASLSGFRNGVFGPESPDLARVLLRLGETATGVAHEMRNDLQTVRFALEALRNIDRLSPEQQREHVESATKGLDDLGGAIRGFLKVARVRPLTFRPVRINDLLHDLQRDFQPEANLAGVSLVLTTDPEVPEIRVDPEVVAHAIENIVRNAFQALAGREGTAELTTALRRERVRITVKDDGPGIPPDILEQVFDLYFTTRKDGSGVGLSIVRQSIEMHGGEVIIASKPGLGTEVALELPLRRSG